MAVPEILVPDKVTITLRDPDRSLLTYRPSRTLIDLLYIAGPIPASDLRTAERQIYSLVYLAQEFGVIDTDYEFSMGTDTHDLFSSNLSWNLNMTSLKDMFQILDEDGRSFRLTPRAIELLEAVGGVQTIDSEDTITELALLAQTNRLIFLANFVFGKKEASQMVEDGKITSRQADAIPSIFLRPILREDLERLEEKFRSS